MSEKDLRDAAKVLRERVGRYGITVQQGVDLPLADWLDDEAFMIEHGRITNSAALEVARVLLRKR